VGKRAVAEINTFDFILILIIGESTQQALLGDDFSVTNAIVVIVTLLSIDLGISMWTHRSPVVDQLIDGIPLVIVVDGKPLRERMDKERVSDDDVLVAARRDHGLERMEQIKYAVLERSGGISIIPK